MNHPLSQTQIGIFSTCINCQEDGNYNIDTLYRLDDGIDLGRLAEALDRVIAAHPYVKSRLVHDEDGDVVLEDHSAEEFHAQVTDIDDIESVRPHLGEDYDLMHDRLFRLEIYRTPGGNWLYVDFHHIIFDGMSAAIFRDDLARAYAGEELAAEEVDGFQIAEAEAEARSSELFGEAKQWYEREFGAACELESMPLADIFGNEEEHFAKYWERLDIDQEALAAFCARTGHKQGTVYTAAFGYLLSRYTAEEEVLYTTAFHGRTDKATRHSFSMMVKTLPVYHNLTKTPSVDGLLAQTRDQMLATRKYSLYSFADAHTDLGLTADVSFVYQGSLHDLGIVLDGRRQQEESLITHTPGLKFLGMLMIEDGAPYIWSEYQTNRFSPEFIQGFWESYAMIVNEMCRKDMLADIEVCTPAQIARLDSFNPDVAYVRSGETVLSMFRKAAAQYPDNTAVIYGDASLTYRELDRMSDRIGAYIHEHIKDCGRQEPVVSILIPRSELMAVLPLAAMKAGCAYQPLDPSYPRERLNFMVQDSDAVMLIAEDGLRDIISEFEGEVLLTSELGSIPDGTVPQVAVSPSSLFILLYTSGSTGVPKGVMLEHGNLVAFCDWYHAYYGLKPEHRVAAYASFGFDADMMDLYPALTMGSAVVIVPEELRLDLIALGQYFQTHGVTHSFITTQVGVQFLQNIEGCTSLQHLSVGGEKLVSVEPSSDYKFYNAYGPTECTIFSTVMPVTHSEPDIPIGRPTSALRCLVCDKHLHRLPAGAAGELVIVGDQVGRGYLNRPDKTAEAFFTLDGQRAYHSGDIVRYRQNGDIEFVGRKDGQVKIRGFRIELKEVEAVIREYPGIKDCTVQAFDDPNGGKFIAAYVVTSDDAFSAEALGEFILDRKPPYMVPAATMVLDQIPLNVNQKVDRKALPKPEVAEHKSEACGQAAPLNALEQQLMGIISGIVKTDGFGITEPLGMLGLTSITSIKLSVQIFKQYGVQLDSKSLARTGTLQSIENEILKSLLEPQAAPQAQEPAHKEPAAKRAPLAFSQQGVYTECMTNPDSVIYNIPVCLTFPAGVSAGRVRDAALALIAAHPYLTSHFVTGADDEVIQEPVEGFQPEIGARQMDAEAFALYKREFVRPFDLAAGPLFRFETVEEPDGTVHLLEDIHHLVCDGASLDLLNHQLCQALDGGEVEVERYDYFDFVADQHLDPSADQYFDDTIGGVEEVSRLLPDIFTDEKDHRQRTVAIEMPADGIEAFVQRHGITPAAFFLAASALTVSRYLCEEDVAIATISNGRSNLLVNNTAGMFVNTLPLALHAGAKDAVGDFLAHAAQVFDRAIEHEQYPFARVASKYGFMPEISYTCQLGVLESLATQEGPVALESLELDIAKIPVAIYVNGSTESTVEISVDYDSSLYTEAMVRHFAQSIRNVARGLMEAGSLSEISLTDAADWQLLDSFNPEFYTGYDLNDSAVSLFRKMVAKYPDKVAAVYRDRRCTYSELDRMTDCLARVIYDKVSGITGLKDLSEQVVSIIIDRNEWVYLLPLAVLKTGCAYQPLDPSYPATRLNFMVQDARAVLLIGQEALVPLVDEYHGAVLYTKDLDPMGSGRVDVSIAPSSLMLMLYTSGSTGQPKGVQIEHRNIITFVNGCAENGFYDDNSHVAAYASFGFDVCMMDIFSTLLNGGTLYIIPEDMRLDFGRLKDYLDDEGITQIFMTTQVGVQFLQSYPKMRTLRFLSMGGEKLPAVHPENLSYKILNGYGPTENTCGVSQYIIDHWEPNIPLGKPLPTVLGYILDKSGHRLPPGACGEYCVAGRQPARGYLGLPEKTAEVFVDLPADLNPTGIEGLRLYHTGDIVRYRESGNVEFVGRKDGMVKIRGFRIELKEVEAAIRPFEGVKDVTVQAYDYESGGKYLAAYVVSDDPAFDTDKLLAFVKSQKPPYMVPAIVMRIDSIPLTVNQKVDKKALPKPQLAAAAYVAPAGRVEQDFCEIFAEVLGIERVSADSDFFEIGGSSIIALKVVVAAQKRGYDIVYNDVFTYTTAQSMGAHLSDGEEVVEEAGPADACGEQAGPRLTEVSPDGFDYRAINALLRANTMDKCLGGEQQPVGDVLLAGATGFLGVHVLKDLIDNYTGKIWCFIRPKGETSAQERLMGTLEYYFGDDCAALFGERLFIIEGDATDPAALGGFNPEGASEITVINCAASVKHFSKGNEIEQINVGTVQNLVAWCISHGARLVHVSTGSVFGVYVSNEIPDGYKFDEHELYVGQTIDDNQYVHSKFMAERLIYEAVLHHGLNAKVMRVGNLAPRDTDGRFQINYKTNNFMGTLAAYRAIGMIPYEAMDGIVEFSPINKVARAILLLATTPRECVCFMPSNQHRPLMGDIVMQMESLGKEIRMVDGAEFQAAVQQALTDPAMVDTMRPFVAYASKAAVKKALGPDDLNVDYTVQVLYRLGFRWPETGADYVQLFLDELQRLRFFDA